VCVSIETIKYVFRRWTNLDPENPENPIALHTYDEQRYLGNVSCQGAQNYVPDLNFLLNGVLNAPYNQSE